MCWGRDVRSYRGYETEELQSSYFPLGRKRSAGHTLTPKGTHSISVMTVVGDSPTRILRLFTFLAESATLRREPAHVRAKIEEPGGRDRLRNPGGKTSIGDGIDWTELHPLPCRLRLAQLNFIPHAGDASGSLHAASASPDTSRRRFGLIFDL